MKCTKLPFASRAEAKAYVREHSRSGKNSMKYASRGGLTPYHCPTCDMWHLTSMSRKEVRSLRNRRRRTR